MNRVAAVALAVVLAAGCMQAGTARPAPDTEGRTLTVLAAASLTEAFERIGANFETANDGVAVRFSFGPSDALAGQILEGAPADVFASASPAWMDAVEKDPGVGNRVDFARNRLVVVTPADDPADISTVEDLATPGVKLVLAAEGVPAGDYARQILDRAGIAAKAEANVVSNEEDVKGVIQKVALGEADAGIVYRTDVTPSVTDEVRAVTIPDDVNVTATYPIAVVGDTENPALARAFVAYVVGDGGQATLASFGFLPPG